MANLVYRVVSACGALGYGYPKESLAAAPQGRVDAIVSDGWLTVRATTCAELDAATAAAGAAKGAYIEIVTDAYAASPLAMKLHDAVETLYKS